MDEPVAGEAGRPGPPHKAGAAPSDAFAWNRKGVLFNVAVTAVDVGVAIAAFQVARHAGASEALAYFVASAGPLMGSLAIWLRARKLSGASIAMLAFTVLSALAALAGSHNPKVLLYKDAFITALIGLIFTGSLLFPRPLAFYFGQRYATDGTSHSMQAWTDMWRYPDFRRANYAITAVWAVIYLLEAAGKAFVVHIARFNTAYAWSQVLPWLATAAAILLTLAIAQHYSRA